MKQMRWSTKSEKQFIRDLGFGWRKNHRYDINLNDLRKKCLLGYRQSVYLRVDWGDIERDKIITFLNNILSVDYGIPPLPILENDHPAVLIYRLQKLYRRKEYGTTCHPGNPVSDTLRILGILPEEVIAAP